MHLRSRRLVLNYDPGQFTFNRFDHAADDAELFDLAQQINVFQTDNAQVQKILVFSVW